MIPAKEKIAPPKFKGNIKKNSLSTIVDYISFTCIISVETGNDTGALFLKKGELISAEVNNEFHINKANDILSWTNGTYYYQKWIGKFDLEYKQLRDILYFIEIANIDAELNLIFNDKPVKIFCSKGTIVGIEPYPEDIKVFFNEILKETEGNIKIKCNGRQTGDLKEYFSEIVNHKKNSNQNTENKKTSKKETNNNSVKKSGNIKESFINTDIIKQSFKYLRSTLADTFIAGCVYTSSIGKPLLSFNTETNQSVLFAKLHKTINDLLINTGFRKINKYYLLDTEENYLIFILTFKEHHFGLVFDKSKIKLGYLFNIIKPILINDYGNAIKHQ